MLWARVTGIAMLWATDTGIAMLEATETGISMLQATETGIAMLWGYRDRHSCVLGYGVQVQCKFSNVTTEGYAKRCGHSHTSFYCVQCYSAQSCIMVNMVTSIVPQ